jgi:predicted O-methyltransferase YrrM
MDLTEFRKSAEEKGIPVIKKDAESILRLVVEMKKPRKILEIGTGTGYSATVILTSGRNDSKIYSIEIDEERYFAAKGNLKQLNLSERATLYLGDAGELLPDITGNYDMVFLDGPKGQYINFLPFILDLLEEGGVLVCDNVLYRGLVDKSVKMRRNSLTMVTNLRQFIDKITKDERLITHIFKEGDGISVTIKKY